MRRDGLSDLRDGLSDLSSRRGPPPASRPRRGPPPAPRPNKPLRWVVSLFKITGWTSLFAIVLLFPLMLVLAAFYAIPVCLILITRKLYLKPDPKETNKHEVV